MSFVSGESDPSESRGPERGTGPLPPQSVSFNRAELNRILSTTDLWDHRTGILQVTDAVGGWVRVRVLVTAKDAPTLFDLRCLVRERLIDWMQRHSPASLPRQRVELTEEPEQTERPPRARSEEEGRLFSGSPEGEQRASQFTDAIPVVRPDEQPDVAADAVDPVAADTTKESR